MKYIKEQINCWKECGKGVKIMKKAYGLNMETK